MKENVPEVSAAWAESANTKKQLELAQKKGSRCYFFTPFCIGNEEIQLRLDFGDIEEGNPTLDADFKDKETKKHRKLRGKMSQAHHTNVQNSQERVYCWEFGNVQHIIRVFVAWNFSACAYLGETVIVELTTSSGDKSI
jgi:hypothetical protein